MRYKSLFVLFILVFSLANSVEKEIKQGLFYEHVVTSVPQSIHILKVNPEYFEIVPIRALDEGLGRESVSSMSLRYTPFAAVNGGFFQIGGTFDGRPQGILKIGSNWFSLPNKPRGAIGWKKSSKEVLIDQLLASCFICSKEKLIKMHGLNRSREKGEVILFTPNFHKSTLTNPDGKEFIFKNGVMDEVISKKGSNFIPLNGWVVSIEDSSKELTSFSTEDFCSLSFSIYPQSNPAYTSGKDWEGMDYIVGGTPVLIRNGVVIKDFTSEKTIETFLTKRHSRTAIGILKDGSWVFLVVDGKRPGVTEGMTMEELANYMASLGCIEALNLDGGGSSIMVIDSEVTSEPYGDEDESPGKFVERRVSDAILIFEKNSYNNSKRSIT